MIARALVAAVHASELETVLEYHSPSQLFSAALLYSIGDLAVSNQAPDLYVSLRNLAQTHRTPAARILKETTMLINAMTGPHSKLETESAKRSLLSGTGLPSQLFGDLLVRALHRVGGLARAALALLNPNDSDQLIGRLLPGVEQPAPFLGSLSGSLTKEHPYFLSLVKRDKPSLVEDFFKPTSHAVCPDFLRVWAPSSAIIAPPGTRPVGMIYGDTGPVPGRVLPKDLQAFQLFFSQTTLSMNRLAGVL